MNLFQNRLQVELYAKSRLWVAGSINTVSQVKRIIPGERLITRDPVLAPVRAASPKEIGKTIILSMTSRPVFVDIVRTTVRALP